MSARSSTVGPAPFFSTPTTPVPPTLGVTTIPGTAFSSAAIRAPVFSSLKESSGFRWK